ncbi:MAG: insulinase family protein [Thermoguttaceae bacterium]|nr:insulinase family protein [Thermoguttaceae bacterium]
MKDPLPAKSLFSRLAFPALKICRALSLFIPAGLLFLAAGRAAAQDPYRDADAAGPAQGVQAVSHTVYEDGLAFYEFSNGLSLFVLPAETDAATVRAYVRNTGSAHEGALLGSGISHLTEHIVCGGSTSRRSEEETRSILERLGGRFNAATGSELTSYYIDCSSETVPAALDLLAGWMTDCAVDPDEFAREKQVIARELADAENDPQQVAAEQVLRTVYREHPLRHPAGGYPDVFRTLSPEAVKDFYKTHYTPNNTIFFVAGRVQPEEVLRELAEQYREIPRAPEIEPVPYSEPVQIAPRETVIEMPGETYQLRLAWPTAAIDSADAPALDVLAVLLAGGVSGELDRKLKEGKGIGISYSAASMTPSSVPGFFLIQAETRPDEPDAVQTAILDLLRQLSESVIPDERLARAKKIAEMGFLREKETAASRADACVLNYIITGNPEFDRVYLDRIRKVAAADLPRVMRTYLRPEKMNRVLISPPGGVPRQVTSSPRQNRSEIEGFHLRENELTVLTKSDAGLPVVHVQVCVLGGSIAENESTAGQTALLAKMLGRGTENHTKAEIENYFDSIGGDYAFSAGRHTLCAEMTVPKSDFQNAFPLLAEMILRPSFLDGEFQRARREQLNQILVRQERPIARAFALLSASLPAKTPYHLLPEGTEESVNRIRLDDLRRLHRKLLDPRRMVIAVFGDISAADAASKAKELFQNLPKSSAPLPLPADPDNQFVSEADEHALIESPDGVGIMAWPTVSLTNEEEYAAILVLQSILGGHGTPGGRLFHSLREEGLVYRLQVGQMTGPAPGYLYAVFETAPEKVAEIFRRIEEETDRIKGGDLAEDELARVKAGLIASRPHELEPLASQALSASLDELYGLGFKYEEEYADRISRVTRDEVIEAAQKYLVRPARVSLSNKETR